LEQRRRIQKIYKLPESSIGMIWNGVAVSSPVSGESFRSKIGTGDRLLIGTIAKLIKQKGLDDLLSVALHCRDAGHRMQFVIVGEGPLRSELEQRRCELGIEDTVVITGWIKNAASRVLPEFDVFFLPSRWEAMSIAILEAMAVGKAIVATKVGDNPHVLEDNISGILVDSGDIRGMADALTRLGDGKFRTRLGKAAKASFEQKFTLQHMIRSYERVYYDLMGC
jgi:glycosyltransferase involved in cell wall biosynthesis